MVGVPYSAGGSAAAMRLRAQALKELMAKFL
jgi:hypothetical protein